MYLRRISCVALSLQLETFMTLHVPDCQTATLSSDSMFIFTLKNDFDLTTCFSFIKWYMWNCELNLFTIKQSDYIVKPSTKFYRFILTRVTSECNFKYLGFNFMFSLRLPLTSASVHYPAYYEAFALNHTSIHLHASYTFNEREKEGGVSGLTISAQPDARHLLPGG